MKSSKKGFTIVEIVIALTIISIVTLTATSLVMVSQRISKSTRDRLLAVNLCNNSIAIFQSLNDISYEELSENFKERFCKIYNQDQADNFYFDPNANGFTIHFNNNWQILSESELKNSKFECEFVFTTFDENNKNLVTLDIKVYYCQVDIDYDLVSHGKEHIHSTTYTMSLSEAKQ
ncbi:MAG: type II secretion system protein [Clostridiales bacterium]|nr:type II secretion system protein [Clostridiales bacterium]